MIPKQVIRSQYKIIKRQTLKEISNGYHFNLRKNLQKLIQNLSLQKTISKSNLSQKVQIKIGSYIPKIDQQIIPPYINSNFNNQMKLVYCFPYFTKLSKDIIFKKYNSNEKSEWINRQFGIIIPPQKSQTLVPDILLVPLICFDKKLNRIGYGGGYYDNYINFLKTYQKKKCYLIGIGLSSLEIKLNLVIFQSHDEKLDFIITQKDIFFQ